LASPATSQSASSTTEVTTSLSGSSMGMRRASRHRPPRFQLTTVGRRPQRDQHERTVRRENHREMVNIQVGHDRRVRKDRGRWGSVNTCTSMCECVTCITFTQMLARPMQGGIKMKRPSKARPGQACSSCTRACHTIGARAWVIDKADDLCNVFTAHPQSV